MSYQNKLKVKKQRRAVRQAKRRGARNNPQTIIVDATLVKQHRYLRDHGLPFSHLVAKVKIGIERAA